MNKTRLATSLANAARTLAAPPLPKDSSGKSARTMASVASSTANFSKTPESVSDPFRAANAKRRVFTIAERSMEEKKRTPVPEVNTGPIVRTGYMPDSRFRQINAESLRDNPVIDAREAPGGVHVKLMADRTVFATGVDCTSEASMGHVLEHAAQMLAKNPEDAKEITTIKQNIFNTVVIKNMTDFVKGPDADKNYAKAEQNIDLHVRAFAAVSNLAKSLDLPEPDIAVIGSERNPKLPPGELKQQAANAGFQYVAEPYSREHPMFENQVTYHETLVADGTQSQRGQVAEYRPSVWTFRETPSENG